MFMERKFRAGCKRRSPQEAKQLAKNWLNMLLLPGNSIPKEESCHSTVPLTRRCMQFLRWHGNPTCISRMKRKCSQNMKEPSWDPASQKSRRALRVPAHTQFSFSPLLALTASFVHRRLEGKKNSSCTGNKGTIVRTLQCSGGFYMHSLTGECPNFPAKLKHERLGPERLNRVLYHLSLKVLALWWCLIIKIKQVRISINKWEWFCT